MASSKEDFKKNSYWKRAYLATARQLDNFRSNFHRFRWYATLENKTLPETFPKFPSVLRVVDMSDQNPPITAR